MISEYLKYPAAIAMAGLILISCGRTPTVDDPDDLQRMPADMTRAEQLLVQSQSDFGFELFDRISEATEAGENIFISPLSVSYALGMTYNGADGQTRDAIADVLRLSGLSVEQANMTYRSLTDLLTQLDPAVIVNLANSIWARQDVTLQPDFVTNNRTYFDALVQNADFNDPATVDLINGWVSDNTNGLIEEIIDGAIDPSTVMFLINAVYFKANWTLPFDTAQTGDAMFYLADGDSVECRMMRKDSYVDHAMRNFEGPPMEYLQNDLFQAASLPYGQQGFRMTLILPYEDVSLDLITSKLNSDDWAIWRDQFEYQRFWLSLPKFKFAYETSMNEVLKLMGMEIAFSPGAADFSNMIAGGDLWIDEVKHKSFVQVDELGTEAAAVTAVVIATSIPPSITCDRPFLFVIHEVESGAILFVGRVENPVWED